VIEYRKDRIDVTNSDSVDRVEAARPLGWSQARPTDRETILETSASRVVRGASSSNAGGTGQLDDPSTRRVLRYLSQAHVATAFQIAPAVKLDLDTADRILHNMERAGLAGRSGKDAGPYTSVFYLTADGIKAARGSEWGHDRSDRGTSWWRVFFGSGGSQSGT